MAAKTVIAEMTADGPVILSENVEVVNSLEAQPSDAGADVIMERPPPERPSTKRAGERPSLYDLVCKSVKDRTLNIITSVELSKFNEFLVSGSSSFVWFLPQWKVCHAVLQAKIRLG